MENLTSHENQTPTKPNNNMPLAIVSTLLGCCSIYGIGFIVGIVAIVFATQVNSKYKAADYDGAEKSAKNVKLLSYIALGLFVVGIIVNVVMWQTGKYDEIIEQLQKGYHQGSH